MVVGAALDQPRPFEPIEEARDRPAIEVAR